MKLKVLPQLLVPGVVRKRIGDRLREALEDPKHSTFKFAVAYMRLSGIGRILSAADALITRGGTVSGAVGLDDGITTEEALRLLLARSSTSTVFHTVTGIIFHPKVYLIGGQHRATAIVGSSNLTRDGLYRNIEFSVQLDFDLSIASDVQAFNDLEVSVGALLDAKNPNVVALSDATIARVVAAGLVKPEAKSKEPGQNPSKAKKPIFELADLFPPLAVPVAPPPIPSPPGKSPKAPIPAAPPTTPPAAPGGAAAKTTFVMELSAFDSSHRTGVPGTPEVLIPHAAIPFFPPLSKTTQKYEDATLDVVLNTPIGPVQANYRLWYYDVRATGKPIDEYRLRMSHQTIDLTTPGGGDLLVIDRLAPGANPSYEVTVVAPSDPSYTAFRALCTQVVQGKRWGIA